MGTEEDKNINLMDFQKIGEKSGKPYDILDDKIAEYITRVQLKVFILNGVPYIYIGAGTICGMRTARYSRPT